MVKKNLSIFLVTLLAVALCSSSNGNPTMRGRKYNEGWCVPDTGASEHDMQAFLDYGCSQYSCAEILPGGSCFEPDLLMAHTAWILDLYYREGGICKEGLGFITTSNPSHGTCTFP
ncbi:hypothetical protein ABFS82_02G086800 [Erythranthe guttata]